MEEGKYLRGTAAIREEKGEKNYGDFYKEKELTFARVS